MHIPDGFLSGEAAAVGWVVGGTGIALCMREVARDDNERKLPIAGLAAAFFLVADSPLVPLTIGTEGHLLGGTLAMALLGPWLGAVTMAVVTAIQALALGDGGITAYGLNVVNLALIPAFVGYPLILVLRRLLPSTRVALAGACGFAAFVSIAIAATVFVSEVSLAAVVRVHPATLAKTMLGTSALVGVLEAALTTLVVRALLEVRPDLVSVATPLHRSRRRLPVSELDRAA
jgi:cobalt/nickel transport system permease protein